MKKNVTIVAIIIGFVSMMIAGFVWIHDQFIAIEGKLAKMDMLIGDISSKVRTMSFWDKEVESHL